MNKLRNILRSQIGNIYNFFTTRHYWGFDLWHSQSILSFKTKTSVLFSAHCSFTLNVKGELFWKRSLNSLLIWSTGKTEAGCIKNVRRGTVQMCCCTMPWSEAIILHQMLLSGEEKKIPLSHSSSAFSFEWAKCSSVWVFSDFWVFMRIRVLRSLFQILSQFRKIIQTKNWE